MTSMTSIPSSCQRTVQFLQEYFITHYDHLLFVLKSDPTKHLPCILLCIHFIRSIAFTIQFQNVDGHRLRDLTMAILRLFHHLQAQETITTFLITLLEHGTLGPM